MTSPTSATEAPSDSSLCVPCAKNPSCGVGGRRIAAGKPIFTNGIPEKGIPPCGSCHGPGGTGQDKFPRLAGQHADYLIKQLTVFQRTDERPEGSIMKTVAHELTKENILNVSAYLQAMPNQ